MMLASMLGVGEAEATERLALNVLITAEAGWKWRWAGELAEVLCRTVVVTMISGSNRPDLEIVIGTANPRAGCRCLFADLDSTGLAVSHERLARGAGEPHGLYGAAAACVVSAAALRTLIDEAALPEVRLPLRFAFADLGVPDNALNRPIQLTDAVVAGAGAVAHGFLHAARHLEMRGELTIVDPKTIQEGILNRCLYLKDEDVGTDKATALAKRAQPDFPNLKLIHMVDDFRNLVVGRTRPPETVFVTVDSRAVRRAIQLEVPHRIIDASTTDARGVIVHSNTLPTEHACLACIYRHVPEEHAREKSIAEGLGVDLTTVQSGLIDEGAARQIVTRYPNIAPDAIVGMAFDSLFRTLCAQQALSTTEGRQVLAPFAFVSAWAGVLLTVEMLRSHGGVTSTNYWSVDPWNVPVPRSRVLRSKFAGCQFCSNPGVDEAVRDLWGQSRP
jgi:hypothetical protein